MFCRNCGKELLEDAAFCTNCGMGVNGVVPKKETPTRAATVQVVKTAPMPRRVDGVEKSAKLAKTFGVIAFSLIAVAMLCVFSGIAAFNPRGHYEGWWDSDAFVAAEIFAAHALGLSIVTFVFGLKCKKNIGARYLSSLVFIMAIVTFFVPLFFLTV